MANDMDSSGIQGPPRGVTLLATHGLPRAVSLLARIEDHWRDLLTGSQNVPHRSDIDAARLGGALPHAFILERVAGQDRFRIAGQAVTAVVGRDARGVPLSVLFDPEARPAVQACLDRCFQTPALVEMGVSAALTTTHGPVRGRLLLLPLLDAAGEVTRALGGLLLDGATTAGALCFDVAPEPIRCEPVIRPFRQDRFATTDDAGPHGLSEPARPYLRLVVSNT